MKRFLLITLVSLAAAVTAIAQSAAGSTPTVDQILDKYVQALGGRAAVEKITSRSQKGTFEIPEMGAGGTFEGYEKAPNKSLFVIEIGGFGTVSEGFNGTVAWSADPQSGLREKTGDELAYAKLDSDFHKAIKLKELYPKMTAKGKMMVGQKETYVIEATPATGAAEKWYFDAQTGLLIRIDMERETPLGKVPLETYFDNYKEVDGLKVPFTMRQTNPNFSFTMTISEIKQNVEIEDAKFNKPSGQ